MGYVTRAGGDGRARGSGDERRLEPVDGLVGAALHPRGEPGPRPPPAHPRGGGQPRPRRPTGGGRRSTAAACLPTPGPPAPSTTPTSATGCPRAWGSVDGHRAGHHELAGIDPEVVGGLLHPELGDPRQLAAAGADSTARRHRVAWAATRDPKEATDGPASWPPLAGPAAAVGWTAAELSAALRRGAAAPGPRLDEHRFAAGWATRCTARSPDARRWRPGPARCAAGRRSPTSSGASTGWPPGAAGSGWPRSTARRPRWCPPRHLLAALGPRPGSPRLLETWQAGPSAVDPLPGALGSDRSGRGRWAPTGSGRGWPPWRPSVGRPPGHDPPCSTTARRRLGHDDGRPPGGAGRILGPAAADPAVIDRGRARRARRAGAPRPGPGRAPDRRPPGHARAGGVGRGEPHPADPVAGVEGQGRARAGRGRRRRPGAARRCTVDQLTDGRRRPSGPGRHAHRAGGHLLLAGRGPRAPRGCGMSAMPAQDHRGAEEGEEGVGLGAPAARGPGRGPAGRPG